MSDGLPATVYEADLTYVERGFAPGVQVGVRANGTIAFVARGEAVTDHRLARRALLPGFINAHSHAFQRGLRGLAEAYPVAAGSFWTWRDEMYALTERLGPADFRRLCVMAFEEMIAAGITTVGEFHYLHHDESCAGFAFDDVLLDAAAHVGIRLVLLQSHYVTGGVGRPLQGGQRRFDTRDADAFLARVERLAARSEPAAVGLAPHSVRAVPVDQIIRLAADAARRGAVLHMHVEEQQREIDDFRALTGLSPLEWINRERLAGPGFTAIHCTFSQPDALENFIAAGGNVCVCPLSEANLGDGIPDIPRLAARGDSLCIGTDANTRLDMFEELRWIEYVQRLRFSRRGICVGAEGRVAQTLLRFATANGARALGIRAGSLEPGLAADFFTVDLDHPALRGWRPDTLATCLVFGAGAEVVRDVCVGGQWVRRN